MPSMNFLGLYHSLRLLLLLKGRSHGERASPLLGRPARARALLPLRGGVDNPPACRPSQARAMLATCPAMSTTEHRATAAQFAVLPVVVRGFAGADALGVSMRALPHGSAETLASGIFLSDSW
jgi:hypothetical protein